MNSHPFSPRFVLSASNLALLILLLCCITRPAHAAAEPLPKPSANAGRKGVYKVATKHKGWNYLVCAPDGISAQKPAGIHMFFHGLGGQSMASNFQLWKPFLQAGCICINMEYGDGNPHKQRREKADAARLAVRQVLADYPVVIGRGAISAFSAGGSPVGAWFAMHAQKAKHPSADWPFSHINVFGAGLNCGPETTAIPTSWMRVMGDGEERMARGLCTYMSSRSASNLTDPLPTACREIVFLIGKGRGHIILPNEVQLAAQVYARAALMHAPFLYKPVDIDAKIARIIDVANSHTFADALALHDKTRGAPAGLKRMIKAQMQTQAKVAMSLMQSDPILARHYLDLCLRQCAGTDAEKSLQATTSGSKAKGAKQWRELHQQWCERFAHLFPAGLRLDAKAVPWLEDLIKKSGPESLHGQMAKRFLAFK